MLDLDSLSIVAVVMAGCGYYEEAVTLGTSYNALLNYTPLWGIIKDVRSRAGIPKPLLHKTRLMYAARCGDIERFEWLLARGANPHLVDEKQFSALHYASFHGHKEIVRRLIELHVDMNAVIGFDSKRALNLAAKNRHKEVVQMLLGAGAKSNEVTSAIYDTIDQGPFQTNTNALEDADTLTAEIVNTLYTAGQTIYPNEITLAFRKVIAGGQLKTLKVLIAHGCNPMAYYYVFEHEPFLHLAIAQRRVEILRELCKIGMWVNGLDSDGRSPLDMIDVWKRCFGTMIYTEIETKLDAMQTILLAHGAKKMMYRSLKYY
jgi:hypothetical protein